MLIFDVLRLLLSAAICAVGYRIRGGALNGDDAHPRWGTTQARIVGFGGSCALACLLYLPPWWLVVGMVFAMWPGTTIGQGRSIDMGHREGKFWPDFLFQTGRDAIGMVLGAVLLYLGGYAWWWLILAGLLGGVAYATAWRFPYTFKPLEVYKHDPPSLAELRFGAFVGVGLSLALLNAGN